MLHFEAVAGVAYYLWILGCGIGKANLLVPASREAQEILLFAVVSRPVM